MKSFTLFTSPNLPSNNYLNSYSIVEEKNLRSIMTNSSFKRNKSLSLNYTVGTMEVGEKMLVIGCETCVNGKSYLSVINRDTMKVE